MNIEGDATTIAALITLRKLTKQKNKAHNYFITV